MLQSIRLQSFLSFGPDSETIELGPLNLLIGPNASGKSNLIEAIALMRATPLNFTESEGSLGRLIARGGGEAAWVWKGGAQLTNPTISLVLNGEVSALEHKLSINSGPWQMDERVSEVSLEGHHFLFTRDGDPRLKSADGMVLTLGDFDEDSSVLAQRRDPERFPQLSVLTDFYSTIRIYREWQFGRQTSLRLRQRADSRNDRLDENFSNLGLVLSRLRRTPRVKANILRNLQDLYEGVSDFEPVVEGGGVQVFFTEGDFSIPATRLSDGTLRYLCLLAILCDPKPPPLICIEEPELGLHPDILPKLADLLREASTRTQLIVTTHSDVLVDAMTDTPECVLVCEKHDGQTQVRRLKKEDLAPWLEKYRLGQLWTSGQIGGNRW